MSRYIVKIIYLEKPKVLQFEMESLTIRLLSFTITIKQLNPLYITGLYTPTNWELTISWCKWV